MFLVFSVPKYCMSKFPNDRYGRNVETSCGEQFVILLIEILAGETTENMLCKEYCQVMQDVGLHAGGTLLLPYLTSP